MVRSHLFILGIDIRKKTLLWVTTISGVFFLGFACYQILHARLFLFVRWYKKQKMGVALSLFFYISNSTLLTVLVIVLC